MKLNIRGQGRDIGTRFSCARSPQTKHLTAAPVPVCNMRAYDMYVKYDVNGQSPLLHTSLYYKLQFDVYKQQFLKGHV